MPSGGSLVEISCRTVHGRLLLRPSPALNEATLGVLARAARLWAVAVCAFAFLSNHYHLLVWVADTAPLAAFMGYLNSNLAREAGRLAHWREKFWGRRYQAILVSDEEAAQVGRLAYILAQGAKEGLVASPLDWPGVHCARALVEGTTVAGTWRSRTLESKALRKGVLFDPAAFVEREELVLSPLPCWQALQPAEQREQIRQLIEEIEVAAKLREEETGKPPLGREAICKQNPHDEPNRMKKSPAPLVHAVDPAVRRVLCRAYFSFVEAYRYAARRLREGVTDIEFPEGAFPPPRPVRFASRSG